MRKTTGQVLVGDLLIGGGAPVSIQSMLNRPSEDIEGNVLQAKELEAAGCQMVRVALPDCSSVLLVEAIKKAVSIPVVADIHFDYRIALEAVAAGADKIRINPGNIGGKDRVKKVVKACQNHKIPIRIGVNSGSIEKKILERFGGSSAEAMVESAAGHVKLLEEEGFFDIVLSLKSSDLHTNIKAYRMASKQFDYPLHLGVTEAGGERLGLIKSAIGIGSLLSDGIGDTIRVSLTADPVLEIQAAKDILRVLGHPGYGVQIISCPTCGRTRIDVIGIANELEKHLGNCKKNLTVAIMGCVVNGPGEAAHADIGIAGGNGSGVLFVKGKIIQKLRQDDLLDALLSKIEEF